MQPMKSAVLIIAGFIGDIPTGESRTQLETYQSSEVNGHYFSTLIILQYNCTHHWI